MRKTFIIAEAGVNHNGALALAKKLVDVAVKSGADAVKFQTFKAEKLVTPTATKAEYQLKNMGDNQSQFEMLKKLELPLSSFERLFLYCRKKKIIFMSSPFDEESADFLDKLGMKIFKIPSGEITNSPLLRKIGSFGKRVIVSTGMADLREISEVLEVLIKTGTKKASITVLQCNTEYPTPYNDANLLAMHTIKRTFRVNVGYSDHTLGIEVPIAATALGATVIEKHFTLSRDMQGPDHRASLEPEELCAMVKAIRNIEKALGNGIKEPSASEQKNKSTVRKSIVASRNIAKGERFREENITTKRPGLGIDPREWDKVIDKKAKRYFRKDELIAL